MPPLTIALFAAEELIKAAPGLFAQFQQLISQPGVTLEQLQAERARVAGLSYEQLVPNTDLPKAGSSQAPTDAPPVQT